MDETNYLLTDAMSSQWCVLMSNVSHGLTPSPTPSEIYAEEIEISEENENEDDVYEWMRLDIDRYEREMTRQMYELDVSKVLFEFRAMGGTHQDIAQERMRLMYDAQYWEFWCAESEWLRRGW